MEKFGKKLLSLLIVTAMVLSMVPADGYGIFAVESNAATIHEDAQTAITAANTIIEAAKTLTIGADGKAVCPICKENVTWTAITASMKNTSMYLKHYYLADNITTSNRPFYYDNRTTDACVFLNGKNITTTAAGFLYGTTTGTGTVSIIGTGAEDEWVSSSVSGSGKAITWNAGTLNIYGGTFKKDASVASSVVTITGGTINQFGGTIDGTSTATSTDTGSSLWVKGGTYHMYGGSIINGSGTTAGGNVAVKADSGKTAVFNMYGGAEVTGGTATNGGNIYVHDATNTNAINLYGGTVSGGQASTSGGNIYSQSAVTIDGATVTGGTATGNGGNVMLQYSAASLTMTSGTISGGKEAGTVNAANGGNIYANNGAVAINGGTVSGGQASTSGGNIYITTTSDKTLTVGEDATVSGGQATGTGTHNGGGNIFSDKAAVTISGAVSDGQATTAGGNVNIYYANLTVSAGAEVTGGNAAKGGSLYCNSTGITTISGTVSGGTTTGNGGNIFSTNNTVVINGTVSGGTATGNGGNIYAQYTSASVTVNDGASVSGGSAADGGNIYTTTSPVTISGGEIFGGTATAGVANVISTQKSVTISGGKIAGGVGAPQVTLSGAPVINTFTTTAGSTATATDGLHLSSTVQADISALTAEADILVSGATLGETITAESEKAATVADCFTCLESGLGVALDEAETALIIVEKTAKPEKGTFAPWDCGELAYCPHCGGDTVYEWIPVDGTEDRITAMADKHFYIKEGFTRTGKNSMFYSSVGADSSACIYLNGCDVTITDSNFIQVSGAGTVNIFGNGTETITGGNTSSGKAIVVTAGVLNLDKVNFAKYNDVASAVIRLEGGEINQYSGKIDATGGADVVPGGVYITGGTYHMRGGSIEGGTGTNYGGNVRLAPASGATAVFNMYDGATVTGGTATYGGNIYSAANGTINLYGGTVSGGNATDGGNIYFSNSTVTIDGATVTGGTATGNGGNIYAQYSKASLTMTSGEISGGKEAGTVNAANGGNIYISNSTVTINGGTVSGGTAAENGGNVYLDRGVLKLDGTDITGGTAAENGGNVYIAGTGTCTVTMTDGEISGGTATTGFGGNIYCMNADLPISGGTISGGSAPAWKATSNIYKSGTGTLTISGGSIAGDVLPYKGEFIISGAPTITMSANGSGVSMEGLANGVYMTLGTMTGGSVCVTYPRDGTGFTVANDNAPDYVEYFTTLSGYEVVCGDDNVLYIQVDSIDYTKTGYTEALSFAEDGKAWCPACQKAVEWTELNTYNGGRLGYIDYNTAYDDGSTDKTLYDAETPTCYHYYLSADLNYEDNQQYAQRSYSNVCINLNGHDLSFTGRMYFNYCNVTIMGPAGSEVTSSGSYTNSDAHTEMIFVSKGTYNIYAGTYKCTNTSWPILTAKYGGTEVNLHEGVTFDGENIERNTALIAVVGAGTVDIEGATIQGGNNTTAALTNNDGASGYTYGGGDLAMGGNVAIWNGGTLNVNSGTITGGKSAGQGGNIYAYQGTVNIAEGATVTLGEAGTNGGNISLDYGGVTMTTAGNITDGKATGTTSFGGNICATSKSVVNITGGEISGGKSLNSQAGNIRVYGSATSAATLNISGGVIKDGHASYEDGTSANDNLWLVGNVTMNFSGGTIYANQGDTSAASGIDTVHDSGNSPVIYLRGNASVLNNENIGNINATAKDDYRAKVIILDGWSGQASVKWPTAYTSGNIPTTEGQAGTLTDGVFTAGAIEFTGTLQCAPNGAGVLANDEGTLYLVALKGVKADGSEDVVDAIGGEYAYYKLMANTVEVELTDDTYIDLNGKNLITTGTGTLYGMDSTATLVRDEDGKATVTEGNAAARVGSELAVDVTNPVTGERYIAITEDGITTFHRLNMRITTVSLRAAKCGLYYKAIYECDDTLAGKVEGYGVVYSLVDMPSDVFDSTDVYTSMSADSFESGVVATSGSIFGIMKTYDQAYAYYQEKYPTKTETELAELANTRVANNASVGATEIYANAYIVVETDNSTENYAINIIAADNENGGKKSTDEGFTGVAYSLLEVLQLVDTNWQKYVDAGQSGTVQAFYQTWASLGMNEWANKFTYIDAE